ncbi:phosphate butyryltransferase [Paradesulfitobacterium aromaticivorans]
MLTSFNEMLEQIKVQGIKKKLAIASAEDEDVLASVLEAYDKGIVDPVFVGNEDVIKQKIFSLERDPADFKIVHLPDPITAASHVAQGVANGIYDIPMKGLLQTAQFLKALLNKELALIPPDNLISQASVVEFKKENRLMIASDCAINISPDLGQKSKIIKNSIGLANSLGVKEPKVAILAPLELANPDIPVTVEAAILSKMADRGQIKGAKIDGPLALDNAISQAAAQHKGIRSDVAGQADILIMPDLAAGNIFHKTLTHIAELPTAGIVLGAKCPIVMTSRTDSLADKFNSILTAVILAAK